MSDRGMAWLIGAKIACCGALLLVFTGVLSFSAIGAFLSGNVLSLVGGTAVLVLVWATWRVRGRKRVEGAE